MPSVQHVSTRGEAPPLGFVEVMLAGLARDGGLYVPEAWPRLEPNDIAAFAGRPYAEVAVEVIRPFAGGSIAETDLARMAREAYGTFRHPAVAPLTQLGPNSFVLELFHGPTLAFKDLAMQLVARLMDHVLAARGERRTIVVATSGDTGGAAVEAFRDRSQVDVVVLFPHGRISDVQRRMMTTAQAANIHALAIEGTFDDCQAIVKAMFNHHAFRDRVALSGVNSINWARIVAQVVYYFTAAVALGAPHRKVAFTVPTGNFGDVFAGYVAQRMGLADRPPGHRHQRQRHSGAYAATGAYELRDVVATTSPSMDIQVSSNFERLLFDAYGRDAGAVRALMGSLAQSRRFSLSGTGAGGDARAVHRRPRRRGGGRRRPSAPDGARPAISPIRTPRSARGRRERAARSVGADGGAVDRAPGQISRCGRGRLRRRARAAGLAADLNDRAGARHGAAGRSVGGRAFRSFGVPCGAAKEPPHERRSDPSCLPASR